MKKEELLKALQNVKEDIMYEECADLHYNFTKVEKLKEEKRRLEELLKAC